MTRAANRPRFAFSLRSLFVLIMMAACIVALAMILFSSGPLSVTIRNAGPDQLNDAILHVTGRSYPLGNISAGDSRTVAVNPTSESHLEIEFVDRSGNNSRLIVDCYFEAGYGGTIGVGIRDNKIENVHDRVLATSLDVFVHDTYLIIRWPAIIAALAILFALAAAFAWMFLRTRNGE